MATKVETKRAQADHNFELLTNTMQPSFNALYKLAHTRLTIAVKHIYAKLAEHNMDLHKAYPVETIGRYGCENKAQKDARTAAREWVVYDHARISAQYNGQQPYACFMQPIERWEAKVGTMARLSATYWIESFVIKMTKKLNDSNGGKREGSMEFTCTNNPWNHRQILIMYTVASKQLWNTQCIINCSVLGKLFNQWPTRLAKLVKIKRERLANNEVR